MKKPEFQQIEPDLWMWKEWAIAFAYGSFWLLTSAAREFGPYQYFDEAYMQAAELA
jgi:hypothetical protein